MYQFGDFELDTGRRVMTRLGEPVPLGERGFSALQSLVERPGEVIGKRELMDTVWPDAMVSEDSLVKAIADVRHALDDSPADPRFVQTVYRRGYRFLAPVTAVEKLASDRRGAAVVPQRNHAARRSRAAVGFLATVLLMTLGGLGVRHLVSGGASPEAAPFQGRTYRRIAGLPEGAMKPAFSPDGGLLAAVVVDPATREHALWLIPPGGSDPLRLTRGIDVRGPSPTFSADGSHIYFTTYSHDDHRGVLPQVLEIPVLGGTPRLILSGASAVSQALDGRALAYSRVMESGSSVVVRAANGQESTVAEPGYWPRWSPDGSWIAYTTSNPEGGDGDVWVVHPDGTGRRKLTTNATQVYGLCWTPDGRWILFASKLHSIGDLYAVSVDAGVELQITTGPGECSAPAVSADGEKLVFAYAVLTAAVYQAEAPGRPSTRVLSEQVIQDIALAPEGRRLAVVTGGVSSGRAVSVVDLESGDRRSLSGLDASRLRWTPDGRALLVAAPSPDASAEWIWTVPLDGGLPAPLVRGTARWTSFDPSPDGTRLAGARCTATHCELAVVGIDGGGEQVLSSGRRYHDVRWSPDGRWIAFTGGDRPQDTVSSGLWVVAASGGEPRRLAPDGARIAWLEDSRGLLFARFETDTGLWRVGLDAAAPERVQRPLEDPWGYRIDGVELGPGSSPTVTLLITESAALYEVQRRD